MTIISVRDNENHRWKRNAKIKTNKKQKKETKTEKNKGGTEVTVKEWELNDFVVHLRFSPINM